MENGKKSPLMGVTLNIYIAFIASLDGYAVEWNTILLDLYTMDKKLNAAKNHYHFYLQSSGIIHSVVFFRSTLSWS